MVTLQGCAHHPTLSEANTRLIVKTQANQVNALTGSFSVIEDAMRNIPPSLTKQDTQAPEEQLPQLNLWLTQHNCLSAEDKQLCYTETRLMLIQKTYQLDQSNDQLYAAKQVIGGLTTSINKVVDANKAVNSAILKSY